MPDATTTQILSRTLEKVGTQIARHRTDKSFNEQNTKATLIVPVLQALGWDTSDPDEVHWEYKPKPRYNPVDFALMLQRNPCLFLEAKALRDSLRDDKLTAQILSYAAVAGVEWVVLSNGDEYRIYNSTAPVPIEEKLFRSVALSSSELAAVLSTLSLLSKQDLLDKKIARLWDSHFVDRRVRTALEQMLNPQEPSGTIVRAIRKIYGDGLRDADIRASLRRARVLLDFPEEPEPGEARPIPVAKREKAKKKSSGQPSRRTPSVSGVTLQMLIESGLLKVPAEIHCRYRGHDLTASITKIGRVQFDGKEYSSLSTAAGMARKPFFKADLGGRPYPQTNGWTFWSVRDETGKDAPLAELRDRYAVGTHSGSGTPS